MSIHRSRTQVIFGLALLVALLAGGQAAWSQKDKADGTVTLYKHIDFDGRSITLGESVKNLGDRKFNDKVSSVKWQLPPGKAVVLYKHEDYKVPLLVLVGKGELKNLVKQFPRTQDNLTSVALMPCPKGGLPKGIAKDVPRVGEE